MTPCLPIRCANPFNHSIPDQVQRKLGPFVKVRHNLRIKSWLGCIGACGFSSIKINYSDYPKSLISKINEVYVFSLKYHYRDILLKKTLTSFKPFVLLQSHLLLCLTVIMVSVTSASHYNVSITFSPALTK